MTGGNMKEELLCLSLEEIAAVTKKLGMEKYRARQIAAWMYQKYVFDFDDMTNLSKKQRELLQQSFSVTKVKPVRIQESQDLFTTKFLLELADNMTVETVLMRHDYGNSVCVSTQVGCAMGCAFCASTLKGLKRNLSTGEILSQVLFINKMLSKRGEKVNSIVIMGSGEPLTNFDNVLSFIKLLHEDYSLGLSYRSITLSTCGIVPAIRRLAKEALPVTLAISLHAANDVTRSHLMPINKRYSLREVLEAADTYIKETGRRVTYEYILIAGVNDSPKDAVQLASLLKGRLANVNLIPVNSVLERGLVRPEPAVIERFEKILSEQHINATLRREMGTDIQAACGQLRNNYQYENGAKNAVFD